MPNPNPLIHLFSFEFQNVNSVISSFSSSSLTEPISSKQGSNSSVGLGIAVGILAAACVVVVGMAALFYKRLPAGSNKFFQS